MALPIPTTLSSYICEVKICSCFPLSRPHLQFPPAFLQPCFLLLAPTVPNLQFGFSEAHHMLTSHTRAEYLLHPLPHELALSLAHWAVCLPYWPKPDLGVQRELLCSTSTTSLASSSCLVQLFPSTLSTTQPDGLTKIISSKTFWTFIPLLVKLSPTLI